MTDIKLADDAERPQSAPLSELNQLFHTQLDALAGSMREQLDSGSIPVIVRLDSRLVLALGASRTVFEINAHLYHQLKVLAHIPLALLLAAHNGEDVQAIQSKVEQAVTELKKDVTLPSSVLSVIEQAVAGLTGSRQWPALGFGAVRQFNSALQPAFQTLIALAARDEAEQTLRGLRQFQLAVNDEQSWKRSFYVVCAGHQPRYKQMAKLVFQRWVLEQTESSAEVEHRVVYGESLESVEAARTLVVTRLTNGFIGDAFLNSPLSMNQDVLGEAGELAVEELFRVSTD